MYFDDEALRDPEKRDPEKNKQRISLSEQAYAVLADDMTVFHREPGDVQKGRITSTMINRIFFNFKDEADASVAWALMRKKDALSQTLSPLGATANDAIELLLKEEKARLIREKDRRLAKGKQYSFSIRVDTKNIEYLADEGQSESPYYDQRVGSYMKALIEEYCELPYAERERIYFKREIVDVVELALATKNPRRLKLTMHTRRRTESGEKYNEVLMKPIGIYRDTENQYNYLVGMILSDHNGDACWQPGSVRLTSIRSCTPKAEGHISAEDRRRIEEAIRKRGVQYLSAKDEELATIKVCFTIRGEQMYGRMLHLRPMYTERDTETRVYTFFCTLRQAENYFLRFGREAKVLEPQQLAEDLKRTFEGALRQYQA